MGVNVFFLEEEYDFFEFFSVELGKQLANVVLNDLQTPGLVNSHDSSTNGLINFIKKL